MDIATHAPTRRNNDLAYEYHPGGGTPLLLVHGVGSSRDTWTEVIEGLRAAGRAVIAIDLLGHGESGQGNGDFSLSANASGMRDLLDHLGIDRAHVVGHSLGGGVTMQFQYLFPQRVASVTLVSSGGLGNEVSVGLRAASLPGSEVVISAITSDRVIGWCRSLNEKGVGGNVLSERSIEKLQRLKCKSRQRAFLSTVRNVVGPSGQLVNAVDKFSAITDPSELLIIWGDSDAILPLTHGVRAHQLLPGSRFVVVPDAGHHPHEEDPDLVAAAILQHVSDVERT